jgi:hypothetical protein
LASDQGILLLDFKENLKLGGGPVETNRTFYTRTQCSVLGMALITRGLGGKLRYKYYDFFSNILSHDSLFATDCLRQLLQSGEFPTLRSLSVWTDCGPHFRSQEFAHTLLVEIPGNFGMEVAWNFFGEYHGKNVVDSHFGLLSRWLSEAERSTQIGSIADCIRCIERSVESSNAGKQEDERLCIKSFVYTRESRPEHRVLLEIPRFSVYQCFTSVAMNDAQPSIVGYLTSKKDDGTQLAVKVVKRKDTRKTKVPPVRDPPPELSQSVTVMRRYHARRGVAPVAHDAIHALCAQMELLSIL